ncbi:hypothetical protein N9J89_01575 [Bacteroidia bacterium]|jgi:hypothetical protein|nr:hypothetical protein [Bacteroidota bacterium]MDA9110921.1 hypothetical protein [Bacteroidia bacterium]MDB4174047.1 hypothetical protein [Bacteroidia bacterium]
MKHKKTNDLFTLINSLNKSQKLLLSRKWSREPYSTYFYVKVYQILLKQKKYDSTTLLQAIPKLKTHQLANVQNELYTKILEHLRAQQVLTPFEEYRNLLKNYSILKGLNLPEQAEKWKKKAIHFKTTNKIINDAVLVDEETYYYETMSKPEMVSEFRLYSDINPQTKRLMDGYLQFRQFYLKHRFSKNEEEYYQLEQELHRITEDVHYSKLSLFNRIVYNRMLYHYHYAQRNFLQSYKYASSLVHIYEDYELNKHYKEVYLKLLNYQLLCLYRLNASKKYAILLTKFEALSFDTSLPDIHLLRETHFKYILTHSLNLHTIRGDFEGGISLINKILEPLEKLNKKHNAGYVNSIYYKIACIYFGHQDHQKCIFYLDKIIYNMDITGRPDLQIFSRILKLTSLFELQETEYIFENIRSVYSYLARNKQLDQFQVEIMQFLRLCAKLPTIEVKNELANLRTAMYKVAQNKFEQRPFFYFDIIGWLDSKLEEKSLSDIISERGLGHRVLY